jgi:protein-L-isoaspartate(D-aspartate) O-methyltransferase
MDFEFARRTMVDNQLRTWGVTDRRVIAAVGSVPREVFVPEQRRPLAYTDEEHEIGGGRRLAAPAPFAKLLQLAAIGSEERVLVIGCGSGYSAAVVARLAAGVTAVEPDPELAAAAEKNLAELGVSDVAVLCGPIETAGKSKGPYDVILVEGLVPSVPDQLFSQLKREGRVVALVGVPGRPGVAHVFSRSGKGLAAHSDFDAYMPPLATSPADVFTF